MDFLCNFAVAFLVFSLIWLGIVLAAQHDYRIERDRALRGREELKHLLDRANRSLSDTATERNAAVNALETITKERDELKAKLCEMKTAHFELLNCKIHKGGILARLKSIIDDEVDE